MARQPMNPVPYLKHMEAYQNFAGGLNTVSANDTLRDNEMPDISNRDLGTRGSVNRRSGMSKVESLTRIVTWQDVGAKKWSEL